MATQTLTWTLNLDRGTISFGRLFPFSGNTYKVDLTGGRDGEKYVIYLMSDDGLECLAKSQFVLDDQILEFNSQALWDEFQREPHEARAFHCYVRNLMDVTLNGVTSTVEVSTVAEGDLTVFWNPLWTEAESGKAFTMKGDPGKNGEPGKRGLAGPQGKSAYDVAIENGFHGTQEEWLETLRGVPGSLVRVQKLSAENEETGKWHNVFVKLDTNGRLRIVVDKTEHVVDPDADIYIMRNGDVTVGGTKTFTVPPNVPLIEKVSEEDPDVMVVDPTDDSNKAVNTSWVQKWWAYVKTIACEFSGIVTFSNKAVIKDPERISPTMEVSATDNTVTIQGTLGVSGTEIHSGGEAHEGSVNFAGEINDLTDGRHNVFVGLQAGAGANAVKHTLNIYDATRTPIGWDQVIDATGGMLKRVIGGVYRTIASVVRMAYVELGVDSLGSTIINLFADHVHAPTEPRGTKDTTVATTAFVRDHGWMYPEDRDATAADSGTINWQGRGSYSTVNENMLVWEYTAQEDGYLEILLSCMFYYHGAGYKVYISKADGTGEYLLDGRCSCYTKAWHITDLHKAYPLRRGQRISIRQNTYYPNGDGYYISSWSFYAKV